jgi:DNA-binding LacI/PurR family transcriptional regulator
MVDRNTPTICVVLSEHLSNHYIGPLGQGAVAAAAALGVRLILYSPLNIYLDRRDFTLADLALLPQQADSYLVPSNIAEEVIALCRKTGTALLSYAGVRAGLPAIGPDNRAGARAATTHLIAHGRRRIAHLAGLPDSDEAHERLAGYREALQAAGIPYDQSLVAYGCFRVQEAEEATAQLLRDGVEFDAIFAANDLEARGAMNVLSQAGRRVPDDVAIIGFDDASGSSALDPPLTTVRQSAFQIGWDGLTLLAEAGGSPLPERTSTRVQLVVRRSCGCSPGGEAAHDWSERLAERFGANQGPLVHGQDVKAWTAALEEALDSGGDWAAALGVAVSQVERYGGHVPALRDYLEAWRTRRVADGKDPWQVLAIAHAAKDLLAAELEARVGHERLARIRRLDAITYVMDLLREHSYDLSAEPVLRYLVGGGPLAAIQAQRGGSLHSMSAQRLGASGLEQWQGSAATFPPLPWLGPGETMLCMPIEAGGQGRMLIGVVEGAERAHIDLDDQLLRTINTYRSIIALNETRRELDAARSVQLSLLPRRAPNSENYDIAGATRAARQVGGDLYGYYDLAEGAVVLALGDVAGKGLPAALLMSACSTALAGTIQRGMSPASTLAQIHQMLLPSVGHGQNAAICLAYLQRQRVRLANAGTVSPMVRGRSGVYVVDVGGLPLGTPLSGLLPYAEVELDLAPGDLLILSSDGIVEAKSDAGEMYGFERFLQAIASGPQNSAQQMLEYLFDEVAAFVGEAEMHDDMAIVVARYLR